MATHPESAAGTERIPSRSLYDFPELRSILAHLSHELSRPLCSLRAGFELLRTNAKVQPCSDEQPQHLDTMIELCDDLLQLTKSYLDYAVIVEGARPLRFGHYTLDALVREIDEQFAPLARQRKLDWDCALNGTDASVITDACRCLQIAGNLLSNALKFTPEGGTVRVEVRHEDASWSLVVTDNGPGIPKGQQAKVFEPFFRLPRDEHAGIGGNGLGLALCQEMAEQLEGQIQLDSDANHGTRIEIRFPVRPSRADATSADSS